MALFYSLKYVSTACAPLATDQLSRLVSICDLSNRQDAITGMLLCKDGYLMQILEGTRRAVEDKKQRIVLDPKHKSLVVLSKGPVVAREFPRSAMGFCDLSEDSDHPVYEDDPLLRCSFTNDFYINEPHCARKLLIRSYSWVKRTRRDDIARDSK